MLSGSRSRSLYHCLSFTTVHWKHSVSPLVRPQALRWEVITSAQFCSNYSLGCWFLPLCWEIIQGRTWPICEMLVILILTSSLSLRTLGWPMAVSHLALLQLSRCHSSPLRSRLVECVVTCIFCSIHSSEELILFRVWHQHLIATVAHWTKLAGTSIWREVLLTAYLSPLVTLLLHFMFIQCSLLRIDAPTRGSCPSSHIRYPPKQWTVENPGVFFERSVINMSIF